MAYCTLAQVKLNLAIPDTTTDDDDLLSAEIIRCQADIDAETYRTFEAAADSTRYFDAIADVDGADLILDADLCAITSVTNGDSTTVTSSQYVTTPRNGTPYRKLSIRSDAGIAWTYSTYHEGSIAIVGKWAYSETVPADIEQMCIRLVVWRYRQRENRAGDEDRTIIAGNATILPSTMPADIRHKLQTMRPIL